LLGPLGRFPEHQLIVGMNSLDELFHSVHHPVDQNPERDSTSEYLMSVSGPMPSCLSGSASALPPGTLHCGGGPPTGAHSLKSSTNATPCSFSKIAPPTSTECGCHPFGNTLS
jgi:hypothetical protein